MPVPENIDPRGHPATFDVHVQFATVAEAIKRLEQLLLEHDRRYTEMFENHDRRLSDQMEAIKAQIAEADKRYATEFIKLNTVSTMMTDHQALALAATKEAVSVAMSASEKAVAKAEASAEKRFESINEFRGQLADQQVTFARSDLVTQRTDGLEKKMDETARALEVRMVDNKDRITTMEASAAATARMFGLIATGVGIVAAVIGAVVAVFFDSGAPLL